ncbi:MAG: tetratricopeptide repeat protein [Verrucomicrobiota bacterium]|nr:tetratricopeptide repeat protein [Verrucomicrobiota bacterium]
MPVLPKRLPRVVFLASLVAATVFSSVGCRHRISADEKAARAELRHALQEHDYAHATQLASRIVGAHPKEDGAWARLVRAQIGTADLEAAKQSLQEWRTLVHHASPTREELAGDLARLQKDPGLALESWSKALAADPRNRRVLRKVAALQHAQGRWAEEETAYSALLALEDNGSDRMARALARRRLHRWDEALQDEQRARELAPADPDVRRGAKIFAHLAKFLPEIRTLDTRLAAAAGDDQLLADRAFLFLKGEDYELALADSRAAAAISPTAVRPRLFAALALQHLGRPDEARQLGLLGSIHAEEFTPEFLETISRLDAEISVQPENRDLRITRAWQLNDVEQPQLALEDANAALRVDPLSAAAAAECGYALAKLGQRDAAREQVNHATELDANSATAWLYRGELELSRGDPDAAIASLTHALGLSPLPAALEKRGECYRQLGLLAKAEEDRVALERLTGSPAKQP